MTEKQIKEVLIKICEISNNPIISKWSQTGLSLNPNNIKHSWLIDIYKNTESDFSIKIDSLEDAVNIIHNFSKEPKEDIITYFRNKYDSNKENYLHYTKQLQRN